MVCKCVGRGGDDLIIVEDKETGVTSEGIHFCTCVYCAFLDSPHTEHTNEALECKFY